MQKVSKNFRLAHEPVLTVVWFLPTVFFSWKLAICYRTGKVPENISFPLDDIIYSVFVCSRQTNNSTFKLGTCNVKNAFHVQLFNEQVLLCVLWENMEIHLSRIVSQNQWQFPRKMHKGLGVPIFGWIFLFPLPLNIIFLIRAIRIEKHIISNAQMKV